MIIQKGKSLVWRSVIPALGVAFGLAGCYTSPEFEDTDSSTGDNATVTASGGNTTATTNTTSTTATSETTSTSGASGTSDDGTSSGGETDTTGVEPGCGDGVLDDGEVCDDGNLSNEDACLSACLGENDCCAVNPAGIEPWAGGYITAARENSQGGNFQAFGRDRVFAMGSCNNNPGSWDGTSNEGLAEPWADSPVQSGRQVFEGPGVTASASIGGNLFFFSKDLYFVFDTNAGAWVASGDLNIAWAALADVEGVNVLERGVTAAWRAPDGRLVVVSGDRFWVFNVNGTDPAGWELSESNLLVNNGLWAKAPAVDGLKPWEGVGVTATWYSPSRRQLGVISEDRFWVFDISAVDGGRWSPVSSGKISGHNPFTRVEGITILSYNIASANPAVYKDPGPMLNKLAGYIRDHRVDIVGLQEVDIGTNRHNKVDMPAVLLNELNSAGYPMDGRFENRFNWDGGLFGNMVLSTKPLEGYGTQVVVKNVNVQWNSFDLCAGRVRHFNYHPYPGDAACAATDPYFVSIVNSIQDQYSFLTGDFNAWPGLSCYATVKQTYNDACEDAGDDSCNNTVDDFYHPGHAKLRIDHVFHKKGGVGPFQSQWKAVWAFSDHQINNGVAISDHYPVMSRLVYEAP